MNGLVAASRRGDDRGTALVMVLGIMSVGAILMTTLIAATIFNTQVTAKTRAEMATLASADAGIDLMLGLLDGKTYAELAGVCSTTFTINNDAVQVTTEYTLADGGTVECPSSADMVTALRVTSTATSDPVPAVGETLTRTVVATFAPTPPEITFDKALFSDAPLDLINNTQVTESADGARDANIYSNGNIIIRTQVGVGGQVYAAVGNLQVDNNAELFGTIWASGTVKIRTGGYVDGDVYAASNDSGSGWDSAVFLENQSSHVTGSVLSNGSIHSRGDKAGSGGIEGIAASLNSTVTLPNTATVDGSVYADGDVNVQKNTIGGDVISVNGAVVSTDTPTTVAGSVWALNGVDETRVVVPDTGAIYPDQSRELPGNGSINPSAITFAGSVGYPYSITAPKREQLPKDPFTRAAIEAWPGWTLDPSTDCTGNDPGIFIRDNPNAVTGPRLVVFDCPANTPVEINGANIKSIELSQDTALVSETGFSQSNNVWYSGDDPDNHWTLYWIVPSDADGVEWKPMGYGTLEKPDCSGMSSPTGNIYMDQMKVSDLKWFGYTPCTYELKNGNNLTGNTIPMTGQVYAGGITLPTHTNFKMEKIPIASLDSDAGADDLANVRMTSRFDVRG